MQRSSEPLSLEELEKVKTAASRLSFRHRLIGHLIPHTGLSQSEFVHLYRGWIVFGYNEEFENQDPDRFVIHVPEKSPCVGTLRMSGKRTQFQERREPCQLCKPNRIWEPEYSHRIRDIIVYDEMAVNTMKSWFQDWKRKSIPFSFNSLYNRLDEISVEAGLDRNLGFEALRRTFGVVLISRGVDRGFVAELMGIRDTFRDLKPLYDVAGKPIPEIQPSELSDEKLIEELQRLAKELGYPPRKPDINSRGEYSYNTYLQNFGGIDEALAAAGLESEGRIRSEQLLEELRRMTRDLGHPPEKSDINDIGKYSYDTYLQRFGGSEEALETAGLEAHGRIRDEELIAELQRLDDELSHSPRISDIEERSRYSYSPYLDRFGGIEGALEAAGLETNEGRIPTEELLSELRRLDEKLGHPPTTSDLKDLAKYSYDPYRDRFGGINEARKAAGLQDREK